MLRLGIVDFDSSHCIEYTRRFNHVGIAPEQQVHGARVVAGWPGTSEMAPERISGFTAQMAAAGVEMVDSPEALLGRIDAVLILSLGGALHRERVRPFLEAGVPAYVDKPFACSLADAEAMLSLAAQTGTLLLHASALRFASEVAELRELLPRAGSLHGLVSYGPAKRADGNPGLLHYGIHALEALYALMGAGCRQVWAAHVEGAHVITGRWHDGRLATLRGARNGATAYGLLAFCEHAVVRRHVSTQHAYRNLCREIVRSLEARAPLVPYPEVLEVTRFALGALESERRGGAPVELSSLQ
jgi:predicted dehydrogenase